METSFLHCAYSKDTTQTSSGIKLNCKVAMMAGNAKEKTIGEHFFLGGSENKLTC